MKKFIFSVVGVLFVTQSIYTLKLMNELKVRKEITKQQIIDILGDPKLTYTSNIEVKGLTEPSNFNDSSDVVERIEMLESHLIYTPDIKWIKDVSEHAKKEIIFLRNHQMLKIGEDASFFPKTHNTDAHAGSCTRHSSLGSCTYTGASR